MVPLSCAAARCAFVIPALTLSILAAGPACAGTMAAEPASLYPADAVGEGAVSGGYALSRWVEDWRGMADPAERGDMFDRLKFLPLDADGDVYLTLSGEARVRLNYTSNLNLRNAGSQRQEINRLVGGADLHVGQHLRFYGEIAHGGIAGDNIGAPSGSLRNDLVLLQSFAEVRGRVANMDLGMRVGRQEFIDGPNLLMSQRDNNTIRYALNGVRAWVRTDRLRLDAFDFKPTALGNDGIGDDPVEQGRHFSGVTAGIRIPEGALGGSNLYLDPFFWRLRTSEALWGGVTGRVERLYAGAHLWGEAGPVTIDWTVNHQFGDFDGRDISAWQLFFNQSYRLPGALPMAPRVGLHVDYASGGGTFEGGTLKAAYAPYGNNVYYSYQLCMTPTNLKTVAPSLTLAPLKGVKATLEYQFAWRADEQDAVYRANKSIFAGTQTVPGHKIGESIRAQIIWSLTPRLSFTGRYEHLDAGPVLSRAGFGDSDYLAGWLSFRF